MMNHINDDVLNYILRLVDTGSTFKTIQLVCKKWNLIINQIFPDGNVIFANQLSTLLKMMPDKPWDYGYLSANPSIKWIDVNSNPDKPWNYIYLSLNPSITWEIVKANF